MNEILDLLPIPAERDFPPGQFEARRAALVAAVREPLGRRALRAARGHATKTWLSLLGILALGLAVLFSGLSGQVRPAESGAVALLTVTVAAQAAAPLQLADPSRH